MIIVIDNYDSFTYNLVHYVGEFESDIKILRNDELSVSEVLEFEPDKIIISPGPCTPKEAGISEELIRLSNIPLLGVCLGHQAIGSAFGGRIIKAPDINHGKSSKIMHDASSLFQGIESPYEVVRYHSLIIEMDSLPNELKVTSTLVDDKSIIMSIEHKSRPIYGVQFHPESIDTKNGKKLIENFLKI
ncbi:MAG: aminodeoxychorismate/anthranilate synthase component II [Gammaproteobacteria bacterium]|nr:aminodeoxychorismate/anthranilate synthase component II [Gammaproteobacteria bacterium]